MSVIKVSLTAKKFSTSTESDECWVNVMQRNMTLDEVKGFVALT
jgi:hypothetical protein